MVVHQSLKSTGIQQGFHAIGRWLEEWYSGKMVVLTNGDMKLEGS
jgi:hypothetical protein